MTDDDDDDIMLSWSEEDEEDEEDGIFVYTVTFQFGTDCEVIAVTSTYKKALEGATQNAESLIALHGFPDATVRVRGDRTDETWIDLMEGDAPLHVAIYTINRMKVDGPWA